MTGFFILRSADSACTAFDDTGKEVDSIPFNLETEGDDAGTTTLQSPPNEIHQQLRDPFVKKDPQV